MRVAIVGSRTFQNLQLVRDYVRDLPNDTIVVSGGARGVDRTAEDEAQKRGLKTAIFLAAWDEFGKVAGLLRNSDIVKNCDRLVAFHRQGSRGTADSIAKARAAGKPVEVYVED